MYKRKLDIPEIIYYKILEHIPELDTNEFDSTVVDMIINQYNMEKRNIIIESLAYNKSSNILLEEHNVPLECIEVYKEDFLWTVCRRFNCSKISSSREVSKTISKERVLSMNCKTLLDKGIILLSTYNALSRAEIKTVRDLLNLYNTSPFKLFRDRIVGCDNRVICNITDLCNKLNRDLELI